MQQAGEADNQPREDEPLRKIIKAMVRMGLGTKASPALIPRFTKLWWDRNASKFLAQKDAFDDLCSNELLITTVAWGKKELYIPKVFCKKTFTEVCSWAQPSKPTVLCEMFDASELWKAVDSYPSRGHNAEILQQFYKKLLSRISKKRGRMSTTQAESLAQWQHTSDKLMKQEDVARSLLDFFETETAPAAAPAVQARRQQPIGVLSAQRLQKQDPHAEHVSVAGESPVEPLPMNPFEGKAWVTMQTSYKYNQPMLRTRRYAEGLSAQKLSRAWQMVSLPHTVDLDIENCCFVLMLQILDRMEPDHAEWPSVRETLSACAEDREKVIQEQLGVCRGLGKSILLKVFNGGQPPSELSNKPFVKSLQRASLFCRWLAASSLPELHRHFVDEARDNPEASTLFYMWTVAEDAVLDAWLEHVQAFHPSHLSLHFDGIRVSSNAVGEAVQDFCAACSRHIEAKAGFKVHIRPKTHGCFLQLVAQKGSSSPLHCAEQLLEPGNCILRGLFHLGFADDAIRIRDDTTSEYGLYYRRRGHRTYLHVESASGREFHPRLDLGQMKAKDQFLLHCYMRGQPHCVAVMVSDDNEVKVVDGSSCWTLRTEEFQDSWHDAADNKYLVIFDVLDQGHVANEHADSTGPSPSEWALLKELQAGSGDTSSEEAGDEDDGADEATTKVGDHILALMEKEVDDLLTKKKIHRNSDNRLACPLCPFRAFDKNNRGRVLQHIQRYHCASKQYCTSGTKQMKLVIALHDSDRLLKRAEKCDLLSRSASIMRQTIAPPLPRAINCIDRFIRLVMTESGPEFWNVSAVQGEAFVRRVRNLYYTKAFGQLIFQQTLLCNAKVQGLAG